jgi:hypothetical protein
VIDDRSLANLLGDAENPAHTEWQKNSKNFKGKYHDGENVIGFVVNSLQNIYSWLKKPAEGIDEDILLNTFFVEKEGEQDAEDEDTKDDGGDDETGGSDIEENESTPKAFKINKVDNGLSILPSNGDVPDVAELQLAYMIPKGDPLKNYSEYDFDISHPPITTQYTGVKILENNKNKLKFKILDDNFRIKLTGFDKNRDLYIKLKSDD